MLVWLIALLMWLAAWTGVAEPSPAQEARLDRLTTAVEALVPPDPFVVLANRVEVGVAEGDDWWANDLCIEYGTPQGARERCRRIYISEETNDHLQRVDAAISECWTEARIGAPLPDCWR